MTVLTVFVDVLMLALLAYCAYAGTKRGLVLIGLELLSFTLASAAALLTYHMLGSHLRGLLGVSLAMSNLAGFLVVWVSVEIACALLVRGLVLPHLTHEVQHHHLNQAGGAVLNVIKYTAIMTLVLIVFAGLPLAASAKEFVTEAALPKALLASSSSLQGWLASGLGRDLGDSLNFFTISAEPGSEQRVDLGYTTKGTVDAKDEAAMLVLINEERTTRGLPALTLNKPARDVARAYSADMFARGYFSHLSPEGLTPFDRMEKGGVKFGQAGENLALAPTLALAHQGLMNSPGHRANILKPEYHTVGIGIIDGGPYGLMVTQDFTD